MSIAICRSHLYGCVALSFLFASSAGLAQSGAAGAVAEGNAIPVTTLISVIAERTGKKFVVDPRVRADVMLAGHGASAMSYEEFLTVLQVHGFAVVEGADLVRIVPDAIVRQQPLPIMQGAEKRLDSEYMTKIISVRNVPAAMLVPMLRPLLPQQAHFAAAVCSNDLVIVDTVANIRRIEALVQALDKGEPFKVGKCVAQNSGADIKRHK